MHPNNKAADDFPQIIPLTDNRIHNLIGKQFGRLLVLGLVGRSKIGEAVWLCECQCGSRAVVKASKLVNQRTKSCGCLKIDSAKTAKVTHGMSETSEYNIWRAMISRCENPSVHGYQTYGGRGIAVCEEWRHSFEQFIADMGKRPTTKHSIDRVDNDRGYSPDNCRWATREEQSYNTSRNVHLEYNGERLNITQWAQKTGISQTAIRSRIKRGWSIEAILTTPVKGR